MFIFTGHVIDVLKQLPERSVHVCITSPPYFGLRDYGTEPQEWPNGWKGEHGHEPTLDMWLENEVAVYREVRRVLRDDGTLWVVVGDCYGSGNRVGHGTREGYKQSTNTGVMEAGDYRPKTPEGYKPLDRIPAGWLLFQALQADGWYGRMPIVWAKGVSFLEAWAGAVFPESMGGWRWEKHRIKTKKGERSKEQGYAGAGTHRDHGHGGFGCEFQDENKNAGNPDWTDCPGCDKCSPNDGYVLRRGAWRPTNSYELILMMSKNKTYFCDKYAVAEASRTEQIKHNRRYAKPYEAFDNRAKATGQPGNECNEGVHSRPGSGQRNLRSVWTIPVEPTKIKHFACFPRELVRPIVRVATSAGGVCPMCQAPFARIVDKTRTQESGSGRAGNEPDGKHGKGMKNYNDNVGDNLWAGPVPGFSTLGWKPTCTCGSTESVQATVLDCFGGSGTTAQVAREENRDFILIDVDPKSRELLAERLKPKPTKKKRKAKKRKKKKSKK